MKLAGLRSMVNSARALLRRSRNNTVATVRRGLEVAKTAIRARATRRFAYQALLVGALLAFGETNAHADTILSGLAEVITQSALKWGPALFAVGGLAVGGKIAMGHHQAGEEVRSFLIGGAVIAIAMGAAAFLSNLQGYIR
jgi:hypothetical protein